MGAHSCLLAVLSPADQPSFTFTPCRPQSLLLFLAALPPHCSLSNAKCRHRCCRATWPSGASPASSQLSRQKTASPHALAQR